MEKWAAEDKKSKIYVRVFVVLLPGLEITKPAPAGKKTARMASS
jgi:hypothetical protein